ncbi:3-phosphoshikimate 1-carboxyvinyltransferase [Rothia aeria]|uniref:3-phosphoshikimate 1-carboxyvinyltransferase n=1 Tax=Rothia aeria TaxID=172042 RepID=UPI0028D19D67|nr:3-phosphoshikimate 1-carboxyvinyltransferase [Rothia aeria]
MSDTAPVRPGATPGDWPAPLFTGEPGARATVRIPGSKSLTNRYLLLAAMADSPSVVHAPLHSRDSLLMIKALEALGARFESLETDSPFGPDLRVTPIDFSSATPRYSTIDCGLAGTVMRFVPALAALLPGEFGFDGDAHARKRPMAPLLDGLRQLGVDVPCEGDQADALPFTVQSPGLAQHPVEGSAIPEVCIDASASSQFVSAFLLVAPRLPQGLVIRHVGEAVPSVPHIEMTVETLRELGIRVESSPEQYTWVVRPGAIRGFEKTIEPDLSNAGPFLAAATVTGTSVTIPDWPAPAGDGQPGTTQGGDMWRELLPAVGATVSYSEKGLTVTGSPAVGGEREYVFDLARCGELAPTLAAICALLPARTELRGIAHLRGHETDRLKALRVEINRLGGSAHELDDGLVIDAPVQRAATNAAVTVRTYEDHRMATFAAVLGLRVPGVVVENIATTAKTLPDFVGLWNNMLGQLEGSR